MSPDFEKIVQPRRWFMIPLMLGILLIILSILFWVFPRLLLFLLVLPIFIAGIILLMVGLDLWHYAALRERVRSIHTRYWPGNPFDR
jgi:hypothetical protein